MNDTGPKITPGWRSTEAIFSAGAVGLVLMLVYTDKMVITQSMMEVIFDALMVYVGGRSLVKGSQQLRDIGGGKSLQNLVTQLLAVLQAEKAKAK